MKIIINADDFGHGETRTLAICEAFKKGLLSTTTIMTNMPWFEKGVDLSRTHNFFNCVGLHFNLTEGSPLTIRMRDDEFFCKHGEFTGDFHRSLKYRLHLSSALREIVREEAKAQVERYCDAGFTLLHLDSHHHVHTDFSIARELYPIAKAAGFKTSRMSRTIGPKMSFPKYMYKVAFNYWANHQLPFTVSDFTDFYDFASISDSLDLGSQVEVMVHPGLEEDVPIAEMESFWAEHSSKTFHVERL